VSAALAIAREYGIAIVFADLGDWGASELRSEYDPSGPAISINSRVVEGLSRPQRDEFVALAIGHELYHHREQLGEVARIHDRGAREAAAEAYAHALLVPA
jgi:hypothetical protein